MTFFDCYKIHSITKTTFTVKILILRIHRKSLIPLPQSQQLSTSHRSPTYTALEVSYCAKFCRCGVTGRLAPHFKASTTPIYTPPDLLKVHRLRETLPPLFVRFDFRAHVYVRVSPVRIHIYAKAILRGGYGDG